MVVGVPVCFYDVADGFGVGVFPFAVVAFGGGYGVVVVDGHGDGVAGYMDRDGVVGVSFGQHEEFGFVDGAVVAVPVGVPSACVALGADG